MVTKEQKQLNEKKETKASIEAAKAKKEKEAKAAEEEAAKTKDKKVEETVNPLEKFLNDNLKELEQKLVTLEHQLEKRQSQLLETDPLYRDFSAQYMVLGKEAMKYRFLLEGKEIPKELSQIPIPLKLPKTSTTVKSK